MASGLDDYPRGYIVNDRSEIHLDLQSWMVEFSNFMKQYAFFMNNKEDELNFGKKTVEIRN